MKLHAKQHPKSPLALVYPLVVYSGEKVEIHDGESLAKAVIRYVLNGMESGNKRLLFDKSQQLSQDLRGEGESAPYMLTHHTGVVALDNFFSRWH